ncbi:MAG TPA: hypothetical protein PKN32_08615 [Bacteroidales bacterium]|nr:hypothetical protein [Bacteroidales bacterium]
MKNLSLLISTLFLIIAILSCSGNSSDSSKTNTDQDIDETVGTENINKNRLLPENVNSDSPIPVAKLHEAFYEWTGTEVMIAGYAKMYMSSETFKNEIYLRESTDVYDALFNCKFEKELNKEIKAEDILIIKGTIKENSYWGIVLEDCELVELNGKYKKDIVPVPGQKQKEAIWVSDIYKAYNAWMDKEVTVIGHYNSTTTSTTSYGTTHRIDLDDPETGVKMVGCTMLSEPDSDKLAANRDNVKIRGKITRDLWGTVQLEDCVIVE